MNIKFQIAAWLVLLAATVAGVAVCIRWVDFPVALLFQAHAGRFSGLGRGLGSSVLVSGEILVIASLAVIRIVRGHLPRYAKALFVACCASLSAFAANDDILKAIFGRQSPSAWLIEPTHHVFYFFQGDEHSSFPSGHMVMATAFAGVFIRLYPRTLPLFSALLGIGVIALLIGDWHFVSDIVAGAFVGGTAGFVAGELWHQHTRPA